jgi:endoglucanase
MLWSYEAQSNLYPSPLTADVHPSAGLETIISDSEVRELLCLDAQGAMVWRYNGGWTRRLTSGASLSFTARKGAGTLLIGNTDGKLCCIDAEIGQELWTRSVGSLEWGTAIWADLDGDGMDEAVAGAENAIVTLSAAGDPLWTVDSVDDAALQVSGPIGAADIDGDGRVEIVALDRFGPMCITYDGAVRWRRKTGDHFQGAPIITRLQKGGPVVMLAVSGSDDFLHCFDAISGEPLWKCGLLGAPDAYSGSGLAVGDLNDDGLIEIVAPDNHGHVHCVDHTGSLQWVFSTDKAIHSAASLGDVDGDGQIEVLIASGDHNLYCLGPGGRLEWRYSADLRLIRPATIADINGDNKTDILFGGNDRTLRCLTLGGRYDPAVIPWPSNRFDVAQTGSNLNRETSPVQRVSTTRPLIENGDFGRAESRASSQAVPDGAPAEYQVPAGWRVESLASSLRWIENGGHADTPCVSVDAGPMDTVFSAKPVRFDLGLARVDAEIYVAGNDIASASLRWVGPQGALRVDPLQTANESDGWRKLACAGLAPPEEAEWIQLVCTSPAAASQTRWDDASIIAYHNERPMVNAAVNQVGYDAGAPKRFTAWSNFVPKSGATFVLLDESGTVVFEGTLEPHGRITGAYGNDWGYEYWRGDFSSTDQPGRYRIRVSMDGVTSESWPFTIGNDVLWSKTAEPAYQFFYYQRCGMEIPGYHGACHLDDAVSADGERQYSLSGGWHDAGDYNTYNNAPYVYGLLRAYEQQPTAFDVFDHDGNGQSDFLDEILWGADLMRRMIAPDGSSRGDITSGYGFWGPPELETDNFPNTGDERRIRGAESGNDPANHMAASAKIARFIEPQEAYIEAAQQAFAWRAERGSRDARQLSGALDLYELTGEERYALVARELLPEVGYEDPLVIERFDQLFNEDHTRQIRDALVARADTMLQLADNPFGVYMYGSPENSTFFGTPPETGGWHVGNSSHILDAAHAMAMAYRYTRDARYLAFEYDQLNWILGNNPYDLCLMEGVGSQHPPSYHHRYTMAGVPRGAVPGSVVNGITWRQPGDDRPYFDMRGLDIPDFEPNEVWLPHNTAYLNALASLHRARSEERSTE